MKLKKFSKKLITLSFALLIAGGTVILATANSKSIADIGGGVHEYTDDAVHIVHFNF